MVGMTRNGSSPKRWRPRFSLRTLVIFVTLVCVYFGAWEVTKRCEDTDKLSFDYKYRAFVHGAYSPMPFVVARDESDFIVSDLQDYGGGNPSYSGSGPRRYYLWLVGPLIKLPFETKRE